jgi:hypothetical protein
VTFEYGFRWFARHFWGHDWVAFTPSRFLSDSVYFLAIAAGYAVDLIRRQYRLSHARVFLLVALAGLSNRSAWKPLFLPDPPDLLPACAWIASHTPERTFVLTRYPWVAYLAWRPTLFAPIPASEPVLGQDRNARVVGAILCGTSGAAGYEGWTLISFHPISKGRYSSRPVWRSPSGVEIFQVEASPPPSGPLFR